MKKEIKKYNKLECGCRYGVDNNEEVIYCKKHKTWDDIKLLIAHDIRMNLEKLIKDRAFRIK